MLNCTLRYHTILYSTTLSHTILYPTLLYYTDYTLYYTAPHYAKLSFTLSRSEGCWWGRPLVHADGAAEGVPLGDQAALGRGLGAGGVRVGAVVVAHGLDVAAAAHAPARDLTAAAAAAVRHAAGIGPAPLV